MSDEEEVVTQPIANDDTATVSESKEEEEEQVPITLTYTDYILERADICYRLTNLPDYLDYKILDYHFIEVKQDEQNTLPEYFRDSVILIDVHIRKYYLGSRQPEIDYWYQFYGFPDGSWRDYEDHILSTVLYEWSFSVLQMKRDGQLYL